MKDIIAFVIADCTPSKMNDGTLEFKRSNLTMSIVIGDWEGKIAILEVELPLLEVYPIRLCKKKEAAKIALAKILNQLDYGWNLVENAKAKLAVVEGEKSTLTRALDFLRSIALVDKKHVANMEKDI